MPKYRDEYEESETDNNRRHIERHKRESRDDFDKQSRLRDRNEARQRKRSDRDRETR